MKTILLTGATGFLGSFLLKKMLDTSLYDVIILKRSFSDTSRIEQELKNNRVFTYDVDKIPLKEVFSNNKIDAIIHCATNYGKGNDSLSEVIYSNLIFPLEILKEAIYNKVEFFINTDSYFNKADFSYDVLYNYSLSKKSFLHWLDSFKSKIKIVNIVLEHIYGENDSSSKFVQMCIDKIVVSNEKELKLTIGTQKRDFIYIEDVVLAYIKVIEYSFNNDFQKKTYNIGFGDSVTLREFVEYIKEYSKSDIYLNFGALKLREDEITNSKADLSNLTELNWQAKISFKEGLKKIIDQINKEKLCK